MPGENVAQFPFALCCPNIRNQVIQLSHKIKAFRNRRRPYS
jgi:hypothetical protein